MLNKLLVDVEEIINTLACNEKQPIEIRGAFNAAINLRAMLEQINHSDMIELVVEEKVIMEAELTIEEPIAEDKKETPKKSDKWKFTDNSNEQDNAKE